MGWTVAYFNCIKCKNEWVQLDIKPINCPACGSSIISTPVFLGKIRRSFEILEDDFRKGSIPIDEYSKRKEMLTAMYTKTASAAITRATRDFQESLTNYLSAKLSDDLFNKLHFLFFCFAELGMPKSSAACATMLAVGHALRGMVWEVKTTNDLVDLLKSLEWFEGLRDTEWQAAIHLEIGWKAGYAVSVPNIEEYGELVRRAIIHMDRAQKIYQDMKNAELVNLLDKEKTRLNGLLGDIIHAWSRVEAADRQGRWMKEGLSIHGKEMHSGLRELGQFIYNGLEEVAGGIKNSAHKLSDSIESAGYSIGAGVEFGLSHLGRDLQRGIIDATSGIKAGISGLGTKLALSLLGGGAINSLIIRDGMRSVGEVVSSSIVSANQFLGASPKTLESAISNGLEALR